jgi:SAM-dependent methyltransferase
LRVNGKPDASNAGDVGTQLLLGHLPALLAPSPPQRALVIGVGSGTSVGAMAIHPGMLVDAVEIEPEVVRAARAFFQEVNGRALDRANVRVVVEDAKTFLLLARDPYDLIVSEPSNPWLAGIGGLFTEEYFELARSRLAPGGLMAQWFHTYEMSDANVRLVLRTFRNAFPHTTVWQTQNDDYLILGSDRPLRLDIAELERRMAIPPVRDSLARLAIRDPAALLAHQVLAEGAVALAAGEGPLNSDRFPALEFSAPIDFFLGSESRLLTRLDERRQLGDRQLLVSQYLARRPLDSIGALAVADALAWDTTMRELLLRAARALDPGNRRAAGELARHLFRRGQPLEARALLSGRAAPADARGLRGQLELELASCAAMKSAFVARTDCDGALRIAQRLLSLRDVPAAERRSDLSNLALAQLWTGRAADAAATFDTLLRDKDAAPERRAAWLAGEAAARLDAGDSSRAATLAREALLLEPGQESARRLLAEISVP